MTTMEIASFSCIICPIICILGWTIESLLDWGQFIKLAVAGMVMICIEWWSFEIGSFLAGTEINVSNNRKLFLDS